MPVKVGGNLKDLEVGKAKKEALALSKNDSKPGIHKIAGIYEQREEKKKQNIEKSAIEEDVYEMSRQHEKEHLDLQQQIEAIFAPNGLLAERFRGYEVRPGQIELTRKILSSLQQGCHLLAEAGTGIGKSLAYLVAAALWAVQEEKVVVISTNTIPLQSQLVGEDLPLVAQVIEELGLGELRYELAKGRANYLCKRRLEAYLNKAQREEVDDLRTAQDLWQYMDSASIGDRQEFPFSIPNDLWQLVAGEADDCYGSESPYFDHCFIQQARRNLQSAHLIISNHAMFFTDLAVKMQEGSGILPPYNHVIFDEAHRVEEVFSKFFERNFSLHQVDNLFKLITRKRQTWMASLFDEEMLAEVRGFEGRIRESFLSALDEVSQVIFCRLPRVFPSSSQTSALSSSFIAEGDARGEPVCLALNSPLEISTEVRQPIEAFVQYLKGVKELKASEETEKRGIVRLITRLRALYENFQWVTQVEGAADWAHWAEWRLQPGVQIAGSFGEQITLFAQPINARSVLSQELMEKTPVTLLSATLATDGRFDFIAERLGIADYDQFLAPSPFPYEQNALLVVSETAPHPNAPNQAYEKFLVQGLRRVLKMTHGRTLVLFTSYRQMQEVADNMFSWCTKEGLQLLVQEPGGEREKLLDIYKGNPAAVLFGADSFWEGVDLPGELLKCVVMTKIPFANPNDPVTRARIEWIERAGGNPFTQYSVPMAMIKTKQGFGRLIRRMEDRGAVVMMDSRLVKMSYGRKLLDNLPLARRGVLKEVRDYVGRVPAM